MEIIKDDLHDLFYHHYIFSEVQNIIRANRRLSHSSNHFFQWFGAVFAYSSTMYVRRQADSRRGSISFYRLLDDIHRHPTLLSHERFLQKWGYDEHGGVSIKNIGDKLFDDAVGKGKSHPTKAQIKTDLDSLKAQLKLIEDYANDYVAHRSERATGSDLPTFQDLKHSMEFLEKLLQKYRLIVSGWKMSDIDIGSSFIYDWKEIFTFAWIDSEDGKQ